VAIDGPGREQLRTLAARLKEAGDAGKGFRRELMSQLNEAAKPLVREIADPAHLRPYMPDRYAEVLAGDLSVGAQRILTSNPRVSIRAKTRVRRRKVRQLDAGIIQHPLFGDREHWYRQTGGMRPGFFTDPCEKATPEIREHVLEALTETTRKISGL
jgi:hypothetical protein